MRGNEIKVNVTLQVFNIKKIIRLLSLVVLQAFKKVGKQTVSGAQTQYFLKNVTH